VALGLHPRGSRASAKWSYAAGLGWSCPSATWCFVCPRPAPNAIMGPVLPGSRLALGHTWQCPSQSATWHLDCNAEEACQAPRGAWAAALRREPKRHAPNVVFFIVITVF